MVHDRSNWRMKLRPAALALIATALPLACLDGSAVRAQSIMRSPSIHIDTRIPTINPAITPRINPNIAGTAVTAVGRTTSNLRTRPACSYAYRGSDGECQGQSVSTSDGGGSAASGKARNNGPRRNVAQIAPNQRTIANEIVAEIDGSLSDAQADALARRHRLARLESQNFPLVGATIGLFRVADRRSFEMASRELATDGAVRSVQPNFRYILQEQTAALTEGDPAQYALAKLRLPEAHRLAHGANVTVAVIDSGIDVKHPEFANGIAASFDALGSKEGPHVHGTGIAGAIMAHARLMGSAPAARILAIRAFGTAPNGAESTSFVVLKGLDYAAAHGAQIVNMSFAGPNDALVERGIAAAATRGIVMVAAAYVSGLVALMLERNPALKPDDVRAILMRTARDLGAPGRDDLFGAGEADAYAAVSAAAPTGTGSRGIGSCSR
jgi:subtilisin family serine protease